MVIILYKGAAFQRKFEIYFSNSIHIIAIESNLLNSKSLDFTSSSMYERRIHDGEPLINQCIGEEVLRNYHYT